MPLALTLLIGSLLAAAESPPEVGQPFPLLQFPRLGAPGLHGLQEFRGRKVLLIQFASW